MANTALTGAPHDGDGGGNKGCQSIRREFSPERNPTTARAQRTTICGPLRMTILSRECHSLDSTITGTRTTFTGRQQRMLILRDGTQESVLEHFSSDACTRSDHAADIMPGAGIDGSVKLPLGLARRTKRVFDCTVPRRNRNASRRFTSYARTYRPDPRNQLEIAYLATLFVV